MSVHFMVFSIQETELNPAKKRRLKVIDSGRFLEPITELRVGSLQKYWRMNKSQKR